MSALFTHTHTHAHTHTEFQMRAFVNLLGLCWLVNEIQLGRHLHLQAAKNVGRVLRKARRIEPGHVNVSLVAPRAASQVISKTPNIIVVVVLIVSSQPKVPATVVVCVVGVVVVVPNSAIKQVE